MKLFCALLSIFIPTIISTKVDTNRDNHDLQNQTQQRFIFDWSLKTGTEPSPEACAETFTCDGREPGYYANVHNCSSAFNCQEDGKYTIICRRGQQFNPELQVCQKPGGDFTCIPCPPPTPPPDTPSFCYQPFSCADKPDGPNRDPWECSNYYYCLDGQIYSGSSFIPDCPEGTVYNPHEQECVVAQLRSCTPECPNERPPHVTTLSPVVTTAAPTTLSSVVTTAAPTTLSPVVTTAATTTLSPVVTTAAPTTLSPVVTTAAPTTLSPVVTTAAPTTLSPVVTTAAPTTLSPVVTTAAPTTLSPVVTTAAPTTLSPVVTTAAPTTLSPVVTTAAPTTLSPVVTTAAPTTLSPVVTTAAPTTLSPVVTTAAPTTLPPPTTTPAPTTPPTTTQAPATTTRPPTTTRPCSAVTCEGKKHSVHPNPYDSSAFYICVSGNLIRIKCPNGSFYKPGTIDCQATEPVFPDCPPDSTSSPPTEPPPSATPCPISSTCSSLADGVYSYVKDCYKYFICVSGRPTVYNCPLGNQYDHGTQSCLPPGQANCCPPPTTQSPTTQSPTTQSPTTQSPTTQSPTTQSPTTQSPTTQSPTTQSQTTQSPTTQSPTTQSPTTQPTTTTLAPCSAVTCEGKNDVVSLNPYDTTSFYYCQYGNLIRVKCPDGLFYQPGTTECQPTEPVYPECPPDSTSSPPTGPPPHPATPCDQVLTGSSCSTLADGVYSYPTNCHQYIICLSGSLLVSTCPLGNYDPGTQSCLPPGQADCCPPPTTQSPTTQAPTTQSPTTQSPTTQAPTQSFFYIGLKKF